MNTKKGIKCFWCDVRYPLSEIEQHTKEKHPGLSCRSYDFNTQVRETQRIAQESCRRTLAHKRNMQGIGIVTMIALVLGIVELMVQFSLLALCSTVFAFAMVLVILCIDYMENQ